MPENKLPQHVAIIMDGNGRWAKRNALSVAMGHRKGVETLREVIRYSSDIGIGVLSLYAFSTENWRRPKTEVAALMLLIEEFFVSEIDELHQNRVRIRILGEKQQLTPKAYQAVLEAENKTQLNEGLQLNIALNYGSRDEIIRAVRSLASQVEGGAIMADAITPEMFAQELYTKGQPDVDLLIRTSGEQRLSNFLLYQCAYAEMMFTDKLWPEYTVSDYQQALSAYQRRDRRYGGRTI